MLLLIYIQQISVRRGVFVYCYCLRPTIKFLFNSVEILDFAVIHILNCAHYVVVMLNTAGETGDRYEAGRVLIVNFIGVG